MSTEPATATGADLAAEPQPPAASRIPAERTHHGDTFIDDYAWLADKEKPETIAYLEAENAYTAAITGGLAGLRSAIFGEIKARTQETDLSVPTRKGRWWYYSRTTEGQQYAVHCRREVRPGETTPPMPADGAPLDGEEILADGNELAAGQKFFSLGALSTSPDGRWLAYSTDFTGGERFTIRIKDLDTGEVLADEVPGAFYGCAWALDGSALFYVTVDEAWRPYRVLRHMVGTPAADDVIVYEEADERFWVGVGLTRSERYLHIAVGSKITSESWLLDAADPTGAWSVVLPRRQGVEYSVEHQLGADGDRLLILHNVGAENFELVTAPLAEPSAWEPLIPHAADTRLLGAAAFARFTAVYYRRHGLTGLRILRADGSSHEVAFDDVVYTVSPGGNPEYEASAFRLAYASLITPDSVYDCDMATGALTLLRQRPVLPGPDGTPYRAEDYEQHREWSHRAGRHAGADLAGEPRGNLAAARADRRPLLYGYGSYEISIDPGFSIPRLSLLDRGFCYAIAHIRGGGEMGRRWYEEGKLLHKTSTFTDFVASAEHLVKAGWTSPQRLVARGGSAGGLLMGAVVNLAPAAFGGIVAGAVRGRADHDPGSVAAADRDGVGGVGDPLHDPQVYAYMKSYSPYENISPAAEYPPILAVTSLNDTRVLYSEVNQMDREAAGAGARQAVSAEDPMVAGHGGRSGRYDAWEEEAFVLAWIVSAPGTA
jgi:oligopeptidase B